MAVILVVDDDEGIRGRIDAAEIGRAPDSDCRQWRRSRCRLPQLRKPDRSSNYRRQYAGDGRHSRDSSHRLTKPDAKFICMTGDPENRRPEGVVLLNKPFSVDQLFLRRRVATAEYE